jgi:CRP-like cAMP-binding protein
MSPGRPAGTKVPASSEVTAHLWVLGTLSQSARSALLSAAGERRYATSEIIYLAGAHAQSLYVVLEGRVRLLRESHGRTIVIHEEARGGCLGEVPLFEGTTYPATAMAAEPTRCLVWHRDAILEAVRADPELALALLSRLAARVRHLVDRMDRNTSQPMLGRLAQLLLARAAASRAASFSLGGSQQQAADEIGTVREVVVRGLRTLRERGAIAARGGGRYSVDEEALHRIAAGDQ